VAAYGTVDELNAHLGLALATGLADELVEPLRRIQNELFHLGAELSTPEADRTARPGPHLEAKHVASLDELVEQFNSTLPPLENFVLPDGSWAGSQLQVARTVCRRAEREVVALSQEEPVGPYVIPYLNRLSDLLFVMARYQNKLAGNAEKLWNSRA